MRCIQADHVNAKQQIIDFNLLEYEMEHYRWEKLTFYSSKM